MEGRKEGKKSNEFQIETGLDCMGRDGTGRLFSFPVSIHSDGSGLVISYSLHISFFSTFATHFFSHFHVFATHFVHFFYFATSLLRYTFLFTFPRFLLRYTFFFPFPRFRYTFFSLFPIPRPDFPFENSPFSPLVPPPPP